MIYSVFNWDDGKFDYFADKTPNEAAPQPEKYFPKKSSKIGHDPTEVLTKVPTGAKRIGRGDTARGRLASLGEVSLRSPVIPLLLVSGVALLIWKFSK